MNHSFRYSLGKIIAVCPQCGRRCFKPYADMIPKWGAAADDSSWDGDVHVAPARTRR